MTSIETYLLSIKDSRDAIRNKLVSLGLAGDGDQLERLATAIKEIIDQGAVNGSITEGERFIIPAGLHNGQGSVIAIATDNNDKLQIKVITPSKTQQSVTPDEEYFGLSSVLVEAIPDVYQDTSAVTATAEDVLSEKIIVLADGTVTHGTMPNNGELTKTINGLTATSVEIPAGYTSGGTVSLTGDIEERLSKI